MRSWLAACLLSLSACSTSKGIVVSAPEVVREKVPAALVRPCPPKQRGSLKANADIVNRLTYTEGALATCAAQVDGVRAWNEGQK